MPLRIHLNPKDRLIVGGAVIRCVGGPAEILVENRVPVLRGKEVLSARAADTLAKRLYFMIQLMYVDQGNLASHYASYWPLAYQAARAIPGAREVVDQINLRLFEQDYYRALRLANRLIQMEK